MLIQSDSYEVFFIVAIVTAVFLFISVVFPPKQHLRPSKVRVARVLKAHPDVEHFSDNLPSIIHQRYASMANRRRRKRSSFIIGAISAFETLLQTSGLRWRVSTLFLLTGFMSVIIASIFHATTQVNALTSLFISFGIFFLVIIRTLIYFRLRRLAKFQQVFPDALDLIVRSVRAGLPVNEAIKMISREVPEPVGTSFEEVSAHLSIGMPLEDALALLQRNVPIPEVKFFATSLSIQQETGGNLAEILANLSVIMRKRAQVGKKVRALSSEARASAYIIGSLPFMVGGAIYAFNQKYIQILFFDELGQLFLLAAFISIGVGGAVMAKLVRFEI